MSNLILLPFGVFFTCCILQLWFLKKVRVALIDGHTEIFISLEKSSIFPMQGLWKFVLGSSYKQLGDENLNRHVRNLKRLTFVGIAAWLAFAVSIFTMPMEAPRLPLASADGSYASDCCGKLTLQNGRMSVNGQTISYVVESDNQGAYVLPPFYVGASSKGFVIARERYPLKLRINDENRATEIELMDSRDGSVFSFQRLDTD